MSCADVSPARRHRVRGGDRAAPQPVAARPASSDGVIGWSARWSCCGSGCSARGRWRGSAWSRSALAIFLLRLNASRARASELCCCPRTRCGSCAPTGVAGGSSVCCRSAGSTRRWRSRPVGCRGCCWSRTACARRSRRRWGRREKRDLWAALRDAPAPAAQPQLRQPAATSDGVSSPRPHRLDQVEHALAHRGIGDAVVGAHQFQRLAPVQRIVGEAILHLGEAGATAVEVAAVGAGQSSPAGRRRRS